MPNAAVVHLGCPKNLTLSEEIAGRLSRRGYRLTVPEEADLCVVNSCGFVRAAKEETVRKVLELSVLKARGRLKKIIFTGCMAGAYRDELRESLPEIDEIVEVQRLPEVLGGQEARLVSTPGYAYLKIAEGCDHACAFCIIPRMTGAYWSRSRREILREAKHLEGQGARELILVAQDTTLYGRDRYPDYGLVDLLKDLLASTSLPWIRLLYLYPETFPGGLTALMKTQRRLLPYFDLPFQHASPLVLKRMHRGGGMDHFLKLIRRIRSQVPGAVFRSSFIVGFPGETGADVKILEGFLREARLDRAGFFRYSDEPESASFLAGDKVPRREIASRLRRLASLQKRISLRAHAGLVGRTESVILEHASGGHGRGRLASMAPEIDGHVALTGVPRNAVPGSLGKVRILRAGPYALAGSWHEDL
jgi:ribosomal protein S12 methylthiotransferase